jgi:hypothetical protein
MITTISRAIDYLWFSLRKATMIISNAEKTCYEVDGEKYSDVELLKLANSTNPATWFRS